MGNLFLRFILELFALWMAGYWGFKTGHGNWMRGLLGIGAPLAIALVWGMLGSPKAPITLSTSYQLILEAVFFGLPTILFYISGKPAFACIFVIVFVGNRVLMLLWNQ